ncbi:MAG: hypothetical protein ACTS42_00260 [Candidatus Hodgkinia cicadicola]
MFNEFVAAERLSQNVTDVINRRQWLYSAEESFALIAEEQNFVHELGGSLKRKMKWLKELLKIILLNETYFKWEIAIAVC